MKEILNNIHHYRKVYGVILKLNYAKMMTYRADFISSSIAHTIWATFTIIQMILLTSKTSHVFGWSRDELLMLAAVYNVIFSFFYMFFSRGFNSISNTIHLGRLDGILTKPINSQFMITCMYVTYTHLIRLIIGIGFLSYLLIKMQISVTPFLIVGFVGIIVLSIVLNYSFWMIVMTLTIWFPKLSNLTDLLYQVNQVTKFPQEMYKGLGIYLLFFLFPLTFIIVSPVKYLLHRMDMSDFVYLFVFAGGLFVASRYFWRFALRYYTSASGS